MIVTQEKKIKKWTKWIKAIVILLKALIQLSITMRPLIEWCKSFLNCYNQLSNFFFLMITSEKHLLYILGVNKEQLDYLLAHIEDYYYSFERVKLNKFTGKPKKNSNGEIVTRQINSSKGKLKEVQARLYDLCQNKLKCLNMYMVVFKGK